MPRAAELAELDDDELVTRLAEYRRELLNLRFQLATSQLDNPARLPAVRRDIARVLTLMRDREIAMAEGREPHQAVLPRAFVSRRRRAVSPEQDAVLEDLDEHAEDAQDTGVTEHPVEEEDVEVIEDMDADDVGVENADVVEPDDEQMEDD
jgi:large subunit ribosomal protein L29